MFTAYICGIPQFYDNRKGYRGDNRRYGVCIVMKICTRLK